MATNSIPIPPILLESSVSVRSSFSTMSSASSAAIDPNLLASLRDEFGGIPRREVFLQNELGRGTFGVVYRARIGRHVLAAKQMRIVVASQRGTVIAAARRESALLMRAQHPNVIALCGVVLDDPEQVYLLMELAAEGSLRSLLRSVKEPRCQKCQLCNRCLI